MKRSFDIRAIVMSLFALVAIAAIMFQLQRTLPKTPQVVDRMPQGRRIGIIDSSYVNLPFQFIWRMPNNHWRLRMLSQDTTASPVMSPLPGKVLWLAAAQRLQHSEVVAETRVGVTLNPKGLSAKDAAIDYLAALLQEYEKKERALILQPTTTPAHAILKGAWFAVILPESAEIEMPVRVVAFLPRRDKMFVVQSETTGKDYPLLREELEEIVRRFHPLPSTFPG